MTHILVICNFSMVFVSGLPVSMADVGVSAEELEDCARRTMNDPLVQSNPRKINGWEDTWLRKAYPP